MVRSSKNVGGSCGADSCRVERDGAGKKQNNFAMWDRARQSLCGFMRIFPAPAPFAIPRDNLEEAGQVITCNQSIYNLCCVMSLII